MPACSFSPMGCSCAVTRSRRAEPSGPLELAVLVFDVHPWATPDPEHAGERRRFEHLTERETRSGPEFTEAVQTTLPFDVTRREILCQQDDRHPTVVLTEDGLVLVVCLIVAIFRLCLADVCCFFRRRLRLVDLLRWRMRAPSA